MSEKKRRWKRDSLFYPLFGVLCLALLCVTLVLHFTTQDRSYSAKEKRGLSQLPKLSFESLVDGSFMKGMEDYAADQFPLRDSWMRLKMNVSLLAGQRESEGVYYAKDGTLMEGFSSLDEALMEKNAAAINHFNEKYGLENAWFLLAPTAVGIYPEKLPSHAAVSYTHLRAHET